MGGLVGCLERIAMSRPLVHGDRKGPPHPTPPPSPLRYSEGVAHCQDFDEKPMQRPPS